jgi:hypothetical protein
MHFILKRFVFFFFFFDDGEKWWCQKYFVTYNLLTSNVYYEILVLNLMVYGTIDPWALTFLVWYRHFNKQWLGSTRFMELSLHYYWKDAICNGRVFQLWAKFQPSHITWCAQLMLNCIHYTPLWTFIYRLNLYALFINGKKWDCHL